MLAVFLVILSPKHHLFAENCDFSELLLKIPIVSEYSEDVTEKVKDNKEAWAALEQALPNIKRIHASTEEHFSVLIGWGESIDNFENFTREQVENYFRNLSEIGRARVTNTGGKYQITISNDDPIAMYVDLDYIDGGQPFRDIAVDIVATPHCVFSIKVSGRTDQLNQVYWDEFRNQFEIARSEIQNLYGKVQFSKGGKLFWKGLVMESLFWFFILCGSAYSISRLYLKKYNVIASAITRAFSIYIIASSIFIIFVSIEFSLDNISALETRIEYVPIYFFIIFVHSIALFTNNSKIISFGIWLLAMGYFVRIASWAMGWAQEPRWGAIAFGTAFIIIVLIKSATSSNRSIETKKSYLGCTDCDFSCPEEDFKEDKLFCPECGSKLTRSYL